MSLARRVAELARASSVREIHGGHQSRVFDVAGPQRRLVVKVQDASALDRTTLETRVAVIAELAAIDPQVCAAVDLGGRFITTLEGDDGQIGLVTCYEYADGDAPVPASRADATLMGSSLARLHQSMRSIAPTSLPLVAALGAQADWSGPAQLLHGDFNTGNLRIANTRSRIFDFDDCGYGPPVFDAANALYMVMFDDLTSRRRGVHRSFGEAFLSGYSSVAPGALDADEVRTFIDLRVARLQSWLDAPETAPIGIRRSPPSWHATLRAFVRDYQDRSD